MCPELFSKQKEIRYKIDKCHLIKFNELEFS